jgi:hypothetical protein
MLHSAVTALFASAFVMTLNLSAADGTSISKDLHLPEFCVGCTPTKSDTDKPDPDWRIVIETLTRDLLQCKSHPEIYCVNFGDYLSSEVDTDITNAINSRSTPQILTSQILVEYRYEHQENTGCAYLESKLRDPKRVREECNNVEPGSDDAELVSVLALTAVSVSSFALLAGIWLLIRSFRGRQLRTLIQRAKTTTNPQYAQRRQRSDGRIRG